jgi:hypothetical protein
VASFSLFVLMTVVRKAPLARLLPDVIVVSELRTGEGGNGSVLRQSAPTD